MVTASPVALNNVVPCPSTYFRRSLASSNRCSQHCRLPLIDGGRRRWVGSEAKSAQSSRRRTDSERRHGIRQGNGDGPIMSRPTVACGTASSNEPEVWVETSNVDVAKTAIDIGWRTIVMNAESDSTLTESEVSGERSRLYGAS